MHSLSPEHLHLDKMNPAETCVALTKFMQVQSTLL